MANKKIGKFIKTIRLSKNILTAEMAKNLAISVDEYTQYENGESSIYADDLLVIADILDVSIQSLLSVYSK